MIQHDNGAMCAVLPDGRRRHFQHGPIDLVVQAYGDTSAVADAYAAAWERFPNVLPELVEELAILRTPLTSDAEAPAGPVAQAMFQACQPHLPIFVTPMAAVAGAVADEILAAMVSAARPDRAYVNNGGDIAVWLAEGQSLSAGVVADQDAPALNAFTELSHDAPARGIATSGWKGRSHSLGIADSVTVLAGNAAAADVAATLIANAVNVDDPAVRRMPAAELNEDTDLADRLVTVAVGVLSENAIQSALKRGLACANKMRAAGLVEGAFLSLQGASVVAGEVGGEVAGEVAAQPMLAAE